MNTIKVITELSPEDRKILEGLMDSVSLLASVLGNMQPAPVQQKIIQEATEPAPLPPGMMDAAFRKFLAKQERDVRLQAAAATLGTHPADAPTTHLELPKITEKDKEQIAAMDKAHQAAIADVTAKQQPVSLAEFQKAVTQAVAKGPKQKAAAKEIINKYAASVSAVPEDKRAEVMEELSKI